MDLPGHKPLGNMGPNGLLAWKSTCMELLAGPTAFLLLLIPFSGKYSERNKHPIWIFLGL